MPIKENREYRDLLHLLEIRKSEEDKKVVEGYATTYNEPYLLYRWSDYEVWEQIDPKAFDDCDMSDVIMQYDHAGRVFARNSNGTLEFNNDEHGLGIVANLGGTEIGRQLYEEIKGGYTNKMSFGFTVGEDSRVVTEDHETGKVSVMRTITKISKLYDVSAVSIPANDGTSISSRKFSEGVIAEFEEEFQKRQKIKTEKERLLTILKSMEV